MTVNRTRQKRKVYVDTLYLDDCTLKEVAKIIQDTIDEVGEDATIYMYEGDDYNSTKIKVAKYVDETDQEMRSRIKVEEMREEANAKREYEEFLKLQKKFGESK